MTEIHVINPHKVGPIWMFTDPSTMLKNEVFVESASKIIDTLVYSADIKDAEDGFLLLFSSSKFPDSTKLYWEASEDGGNWYSYTYTLAGDEYEQHGWLCPALFMYFDEQSGPPKSLYVQALTMRKN